MCEAAGKKDSCVIFRQFIILFLLGALGFSFSSLLFADANAKNAKRHKKDCPSLVLSLATESENVGGAASDSRQARAQEYFERRRIHFEQLRIPIDGKRMPSKEEARVFMQIFEIDPHFEALENKVVEENIPLVRHVIGRSSFDNPAYPYEDQLSDGTIALWKSLRRWDPSKGSWPTYAGVTIRWTLSCMRRGNERRLIARSEKTQKLEYRIRELRSRGVDDPNEIAGELGVEVEDVGQVINELRDNQVISMHADDRDGEPMDGFERAKDSALHIAPLQGLKDSDPREARMTIFRANLNQRDQLLLDQVILGGRSAASIARDLNINPRAIVPQVARLRHRLKKFLERQPNPSTP
jgi:RNA polymerase sigma factor (sigma-70 family)